MTCSAPHWKTVSIADTHCPTNMVYQAASFTGDADAMLARGPGEDGVRQIGMLPAASSKVESGSINYYQPSDIPLRECCWVELPRLRMPWQPCSLNPHAMEISRTLRARALSQRQTSSCRPVGCNYTPYILKATDNCMVATGDTLRRLLGVGHRTAHCLAPEFHAHVRGCIESCTYTATGISARATGETILRGIVCVCVCVREREREGEKI
jgi:hypothetical protein